MLKDLENWTETNGDISELIACYRKIEQKELEIKGVIKRLDNIRKGIKTKLEAKLLTLGVEKISTSTDTVYSEIKKNTVVKDKELFQMHLREDIIMQYLSYVGTTSKHSIVSLINKLQSYLKKPANDVCFLLLNKPYSEPAMRDYIGDDKLPPGLEFFKKKEVRIRKK